MATKLLICSAHDWKIGLLLLKNVHPQDFHFSPKYIVPISHQRLLFKIAAACTFPYSQCLKCKS